jgi:hypothetical protein
MATIASRYRRKSPLLEWASARVYSAIRVTRRARDELTQRRPAACTASPKEEIDIMRHAVRPWLLAASLPLFFGPAVGCDGNAGDEILTDDQTFADPAGPAPAAPGAPAPGTPDAPGTPGAEAPTAPNDDGGGGGNGTTAGKPPSYTRDLSGGFEEEPGLTGEHTYLVHFKDAPLATYGGGVAGLTATSPAATGSYKLDTRSAASLSYKSYLLGAQTQEIQTVERTLGRTVKVMRQYTTAVNAATMRMTQDEAKHIASMPGVAFVERDHEVWPETDRGPLFIGAPGIWDGAALGVPSQGEGMVVGTIDSGIAIQVELDGVLTHHPSFDAIGGDGYVHTNPLGDGVYLGGCAQHPEWCTDKLIGVYSFLQGQPVPGEDPAAPTSDPVWRFKDTSGHGSHVASTAAGNVLFEVAPVDADGNPSSFRFSRISGVAPHANIVAFKICAPSCFTSDTVAAIEQAIEDGVVDVLNYSISSTAGSPWRQSVAMAFLSARAAGIFVAASAGNNGPTAGTAGRGNSAPWVAATAALSHDRRFPSKLLTDLAGGDTTPPPPITGLSITGGFSGRIVHARNFRVGSPGQPNFDQPEQCLQPFPAGTFQPDMIVVCERGTIARVDKGRNVRDGGAGGLILANIAGGSNTVDADPHVIPAININIAQGDALRAWLATGTGHTGTITGTEQPVSDLAVSDIMASFSSRGPYNGFDILAPSVAAPGLAIFAAGAQILFQHPGAPSVPGLYGTIQGTSMASPHMAGSAALLKDVHPDWTDAEILSAFMTTGKTTIRKENGVTPATPFEYGGGRLRVDLAARAGLVLDEPATDFTAANPDVGGDPLALNVAALVEETCIANCSWTRTVRATRSATWTVTGSPFVQVTPSTFTLAEGQLQTLSITANVAGLALNSFAFGTVTLTAGDPALPVQVIQVVVRPAKSNVGRTLSIRATRDAESVSIDGLRSIEISQLTTRSFGLGRADITSRSVGQDSTTASPYDNLADVSVTLVPFTDLAQQFIVETLSSTSPDLDLFVGRDANRDGLPSASEEVCRSAGATAIERCALELGGNQSGQPPFWVVVQNFSASAPGASDAFELATAFVGPQGNGLAVIGPTAVAAGQTFGVRVAWDIDMAEGEIYYGRASVYTDASVSAAAFLGNIDVRIERGPDDVSVSVPSRVRAGESMTVSVRVQPNFQATNRVYDIDVPVPAGTTYVTGSGGTFDGDSVRFRVTRIPTTPDVGQVQTLTFRLYVKSAAKGQILTAETLDTVNRPDTKVERSEGFFAVQAFTFMGFRSPVTNGATIKIGPTVPVSFQLADVETKQIISSGVAFAEVRDGSGQVIRTGLFQGVSGVFTYSFATAGLTPGKYTITAVLSDGFDYTVSFSLVQ